MLPLDEEETYTLLFNRKVWKGIWYDCYPKVTFSFFALVPQHSLELELMSLMWMLFYLYFCQAHIKPSAWELIALWLYCRLLSQVL
jgi:hypothetical protein